MFDEALLIVLIEYDKISVEGQVIGLPAQDTGTDGVKCSKADAAGSLPEFFVDAVFDLTGGFVCECDGEDVEGADTEMVYEVGDPLGEDFGFPGAGACQNDDWA